MYVFLRNLAGFKWCFLVDLSSSSLQCGLAATASIARELTARRTWTKRWVRLQNTYVQPCWLLPSSVRTNNSDCRAAGTCPAVIVLLSNLFSFLSTCKSRQISFGVRESNLIWFMPWPWPYRVKNYGSRRNVQRSAELQPWKKNSASLN